MADCDIEVIEVETEKKTSSAKKVKNESDQNESGKVEVETEAMETDATNEEAKDDVIEIVNKGDTKAEATEVAEVTGIKSSEKPEVVDITDEKSKQPEETDNKNQEPVTVEDDSDSDNDCTLAVLAKSAKKEKLKLEASKLGAKPLEDLFATTGEEQLTAAETEERKKRAIELRKQAEEKRAEEKRAREEEKKRRDQEKQEEAERTKKEKEEAKKIANEKKLEEKRLKAEERDKLKKEEDKLNKQKHIDFQKIERDEARRLIEEKRQEERRKREEAKEEEKKVKEEERVKREEEKLQKEQERLQKEQERMQREREKQQKEQERQHKMKEAEKQRQEKEETRRLAEEEKKKAEERENLKRQKQKQFFGSFFRSPGGASVPSGVSRRSSAGDALTADGGDGIKDADIMEVLPNGQVKPVIDESKNSRRYIGPFVAFEPLPGMQLMPHRRRPKLDTEAFDAACLQQDQEVSISTVFNEERKVVTKRNLHALMKDFTLTDGQNETEGVPIAYLKQRHASKSKQTVGLTVKMKRDSSFVGYLRELIVDSGESSDDSNDSKKHPSDDLKNSADKVKSSEMKESNVVPEPSSDVDEDELKVVQPSSEVIETQDAGLKSDKTDVINLAEDSIVVLDGPSENETETQDAVEEKYELQKLNFKDIKELDLFLLQPTNSGSRKFLMRGKYIRIRHYGEDKSWLDYFGSWRKLPLPDCPLYRRPVMKLEKFFDYNEEDDFYSDVEEAGESVDESGDEVAAGGSGAEDENEYDYEDEGFLVPHGYLSEEEGGEGEQADTENLKKQTKEWEARFKKKCVKMVPRMVGPYYLSADMDPSKPVELIQLSAVFLCDTSQPIQVFSTDDEQCRANKDKLGQKKKNGEGENVVTVIPKAAMPSLIRLVHGNTKGLKLLVEEFRAFWAKETETLENPQGDNLSRKKLEIKILSMADREKREKEFVKVCWYVSKEVLRQYRLSKLPVPNPSCNSTTGKENQKEEDKSTTPGIKTFDITEPPSKRAKIANH